MTNQTRRALAVGNFLLDTQKMTVPGWLHMSSTELLAALSWKWSGLTIGLLVLLLLTVVIGAIYLARIASRRRKGSRAPALVPKDFVQAASVQTDQAEKIIQQVKDKTVHSALQRELGELRTSPEKHEFHVVVFGTSSAGKTSLINSLLGRQAGETEAILGTTKHAVTHTYRVDGLTGTVLITDTPGLSEIGAGGESRECEARELAVRADLLIFVLDHDLIRSEFTALSDLARQGKRSIVLLNKTDRFSDEDREAILVKLRERLRGLVPAEDVVAGAANPRPVSVLVRNADGTTLTALEEQQPDLTMFRDRVAQVLKDEGETLRVGNLLLRAQLLSHKAQDQLAKERAKTAKEVIEKFQWMTAATAFTNPFPALELIASGSVQFQMIAELAGIYGITLSPSVVRVLGTEMIQTLVKLGLVEATTSLIAGIFKSSLVGYAAGGALQAVSMAYLSHISGAAFAEYFRSGQTWGEGGLHSALIRQFDLTNRTDFLQEFTKQAVQKVSSRLISGSPKSEGSPTNLN